MSDFVNAMLLDELNGLKRLADSLAKFQTMLDTCSEYLDGSKARFSLVSLSKNSPVDIVLAPKSDSLGIDRLMHFVASTIDQVNRGVQPDCPPRVLGSFLIGSRFKVGYGILAPETSDLFESNLKGFLKRQRKEFQTIVGRIEAIDIHEKREFRIFPRIGKAVRCQFEKVHFPEVHKSIGQVSEISGVATISKGDSYPDIFKVESIKVLEKQGPFTRSLRGIAYDAYGNESSVAYVRKIRDNLERELTGG